VGEEKMTIVCKYCGAQDGFYVEERVTGKATVYYTNNGDYAEENGQMYDDLKHSGGKIAYCSNCDKSMGKSEDLKSGNYEGEHYE
jgi:hypothetical protein